MQHRQCVIVSSRDFDAFEYDNVSYVAELKGDYTSVDSDSCENPDDPQSYQCSGSV